jgi:dynactin complex subunit
MSTITNRSNAPPTVALAKKKSNGNTNALLKVVADNAALQKKCEKQDRLLERMEARIKELEKGAAKEKSKKRNRGKVVMGGRNPKMSVSYHPNSN